MKSDDAIEEMINNPKNALFKLAIPVVVSFGCILLNLFFDSLWVSGLGNVDVSAVGLTTPIFSLLIIIGTGIGTAVNVSLAKAIGEKNVAGSNSIIKNVCITVICLAILVPLLILPFLGPILGLMGIEKTYFNVAYDYISILILFIGVFYVSDISPFLLRLQGLIKIPVYITVSTSILNIILDPIFIYTFNFGIRGAAMATVISASVSSILLIIMIYRNRSEYIGIGDLAYNRKRDFAEFINLVKISVPVIFQSAGSIIFSIILNGFFIYEGLVYITAFSFSSKILSFVFLPLNAFSSSMQSVIGFLIGASKWDEITPNLKYTFFIVEIFTIIPCLLCFFGSDFLSYFLYQTKDLAVINQISLGIKFLSMAAILQNGCMMVDGMFISIEKPDKSLYIMLIGIVLEVIAIFIMEYNLHVVNSVYYVLLIGSALQVPIYYILFKKDLREFLNRKRAEDKNLNEDAC